MPKKTLMIPNLISTILLIALGTPALILVIFLPAILELIKPRDAGPRMIMQEIRREPVTRRGVTAMFNLEEEYESDFSLLPRLLHVIEFLPCLEV